jgi:hypothetical protein
MTLQRVNLAGATSSQLLTKILEGKPFFISTAAPNITRMLINGLKHAHGITCTTTQAEGGLWVTPLKSSNGTGQLH